MGCRTPGKTPRSVAADVLNRCAYSQEGKVLGLEEDPWRVEKEEAAQNGLRVLIIDLGKFSGCAAVFSLYLVNMLVAKVSNGTKVDREEYSDNANDSRSTNRGTREGDGRARNWQGAVDCARIASSVEGEEI